ncbi:FtsW/RodA/SpoVE family cell cycle protein [Caldimonas tepidiphila]|uniref:FtsW/RodA/SpoVE family cell cycle protein n=1 Tax=Caldimonas tepidiphila TaxID=2315841 RepID=UPI000E5B2B7B|nr:FtsW/RodA/SpoVE family cell cycle protein [Caldimonas tepidiphila]
MSSPGSARAPSRAASRVETLLTVLAILALLPAFLALASAPTGRDARFVEPAIAVGALPAPVLPALCERLGAQAEPGLRERLCRRTGGGASQAPAGLPGELAAALQRTQAAFLEPLRRAQARLAELRLQQREGVGELLALGHEIDALVAEMRPYAQRHALDAARARGPLPLHCAQRAVEGSLHAGAAGGETAAGPARANALLLLGAALDGVAATPALAASALLPPAGAPEPGCGAPLADALGDAALLMAQARQAGANAAKSGAMRELLRSAGWQWSAWMLLGLGFVKLARRLASPAAGVALALAAWALVAWIARVPWPLAGDRVFHPARPQEAWLALPAGPVLAMLGGALLLFVLALRRPRVAAAPLPQVPASRLGYPGLVLTSGIGWVLLLDLSAHGHPANRYLALYHQGHLWLGMLVLSVLVLLRQPLGRALAWSLSVLDELAGLVARRFGGRRGQVLLLFLVLAGVLVAATVLSNLRQLTSELGRLWLIVGAAWFFFLRGGPLAERLANAPGTVGSLGRYLWPLLFVAAVLGVAMLATRDFGPLLIAAYGAGAFLAASVAMWWYQRGGTRRSASAFAAGVFSVWIVALTAGLLEFGALENTTAARLESLAAPLASANDQLALVRWFQRAAPPGGFGVGNVPWCGYAGGAGCPGVPAQIHSDYTLTAMVGAFGPFAAAAVTLACALWLHRLVSHHGRVTRGEPRLVARAGGIGSEPQAFLSWLCVAWVVLTLCQLAVTVAGNLAVLPLTGVTYPFVSFGMTSLLVNMGFLALCLNIDLPAGGAHG